MCVLSNKVYYVTNLIAAGVIMVSFQLTILYQLKLIPILVSA